MLKIKRIIFWLIPIICGVVASALRGYDPICMVFCVLMRILYSAAAKADHERHIVPNRILILLIAVEFLWLIISRDLEMLVNGFAGVLCIAAAETVFYLVSLAVKKDRIMGFGDYKYLLILGFTCGISNIPAVLLCSLAVAIAIFIIKGFKADGKIAAAPYLSIGAILFG